MSDKPETPFDSIEGAQEYLNMLLETIAEVQRDVEAQIALADGPELARRRDALQLVSYNLVKLTTHTTASRRILNDLRILRRLLLEGRKQP